LFGNPTLDEKYSASIFVRMSEKTATYCQTCDAVNPCPVINSRGTWYWSDEQKIHYRERVRQCSKCESSFSTYEINYDSFFELIKSDETAERYKRQFSEAISNITSELDLLNIRLDLGRPLISDYEHDSVEQEADSDLESEESDQSAQESYLNDNARIAVVSHVAPLRRLFPTKAELEAMKIEREVTKGTSSAGPRLFPTKAELEALRENARSQE